MADDWTTDTGDWDSDTDPWDPILTVAVGAFTLTGVAVNLLKGYAVDAGVGVFTLSGQIVNLLKSWLDLVATAGAYVLTGIRNIYEIVEGTVTTSWTGETETTDPNWTEESGA